MKLKEVSGYYAWDKNRRMRWVIELPEKCEMCGTDRLNLRHAEYKRVLVNHHGKHNEVLFSSDQAYICTICGHKTKPRWGSNLSVIRAGMGFYSPMEGDDKIIEQWKEWKPNR